MDDTSTITYGGDFVQTSKTASRGSGESRTEYVGGVVPQWEPAIESSEPEARRTSWTDCGRQHRASSSNRTPPERRAVRSPDASAVRVATR
jgi:hypothetical protein